MKRAIYERKFQEMSLITAGRDWFAKEKLHLASDPNAPFWQRPGWDAFRKYIKNTKIFYQKAEIVDVPYSELLKREQGLYKEIWKNLNQKQKASLLKLFEEIDKDPTILDKPEIKGTKKKKLI